MLLLAAWQALVVAYDVPAYIVPSPATVLRTLVADRALLADALGVTLGIALTALAIAIVAGTLVALLFVQSRWIEMSLFPYAVLLQVTPIVAIAPLIIIWVKDTRIALVLCAVVVAIFPIISNTTLGLRSVDPGLLNLFRMCRASRWQVLARLRIPGALPYFFGGVRIASGLALIGAVVAEFVAGTGGQGAGLAYQILLAGMQLNIPRLFAALFLIAVTGVALFGITVAISRRGPFALARKRIDVAPIAAARRFRGVPRAPVPRDLFLAVPRVEDELVRALAAALREIGEKAFVGEVELVRDFPVVHRRLLQALHGVMVVGLDGELAPRIEAAGREVDRADDGALAVGQQHLGVQLQVLQRVHLDADVLQDPQAADAFDELVRLQRVRLPRQHVHFHPALGRPHQPLDDHLVLVALVLHPERVLGVVDESGDARAARGSGTR